MKNNKVLFIVVIAAAIVLLRQIAWVLYPYEMSTVSMSNWGSPIAVFVKLVAGGSLLLLVANILTPKKG